MAFDNVYNNRDLNCMILRVFVASKAYTLTIQQTGSVGSVSRMVSKQQLTDFLPDLPILFLLSMI